MVTSGHFLISPFYGDYRRWASKVVDAPCCRAIALAKIEFRNANGSLITPANFLILPSAFLLSVFVLLGDQKKRRQNDGALLFTLRARSFPLFLLPFFGRAQRPAIAPQ
jgi:hypothetical protein